MRGVDGAPARGIDIGAVLAASGVDERPIVTALSELLKSVGKIELGVKAVLRVGCVPDSPQRVHKPRLRLAAPDLKLRAIVGKIGAVLRGRLFAGRIDRALEGDRRSAMIGRARPGRPHKADPRVELHAAESNAVR